MICQQVPVFLRETANDLADKYARKYNIAKTYFASFVKPQIESCPRSVTVQPKASLLQNPAHLKFAFSKGLDSLAEFTHSYGLCRKCKVLG